VNASPRPFHAHVYFDPASRAPADALRRSLAERMGVTAPGSVLFVGAMCDLPVGPHPQPQFEVHFHEESLPAIRAEIETSGLAALVHPLTDDDLADHTTLAQWIGAPLTLDLSVLDPPGRNQGVDRFGKSDF